MAVTSPAGPSVRARLRADWQGLPFQGFTSCAGSCGESRYCAGATHATMRCQPCYVDHRLGLVQVPGQLELFGDAA